MIDESDSDDNSSESDADSQHSEAQTKFSTPVITSNAQSNSSVINTSQISNLYIVRMIRRISNPVRLWTARIRHTRRSSIMLRSGCE